MQFHNLRNLFFLKETSVTWFMLGLFIRWLMDLSTFLRKVASIGLKL